MGVGDFGGGVVAEGASECVAGGDFLRVPLERMNRWKVKGGTHGNGGLRHEAVVQDNADRARKQAVLARVLDSRLDERRLALPRRADIPQLGRELEGGDGDLVCDTVAGEGHPALNTVRE